MSIKNEEIMRRNNVKMGKWEEMPVLRIQSSLNPTSIRPNPT